MTTRQAFLSTLRRGLAGLPGPTIDDIVRDYDQHFTDAAAAGRTEEQAAQRLGDPARLARELRAEAGLNRWEADRSAGSALGAVVAVLGLATFDLLILLPLLLVAGAVVFALLVAAACVCLASSLFLLLALLHVVPGFGGTWLQGVLLGLGGASGGAGVMALCVLFIIGATNALVRYGRLHVRAASPSATAP